MIKVTVQKNLIGLEDILVGVGAETQSRGPNGTPPVLITKINGANFPYDDTTSMGEKFDTLQAQIDSLPAVVDGNGNLLTGLINTSAVSLDLVGRIWRKEIDTNTIEIYYGAELMFKYDPVAGNIILNPDTDYIAADVVVTAAYEAADTAIQDALNDLDAATTAVQLLAVGIGANELVQMTADGKLPAVDGSNLTNLNIPDGVPIGIILACPYSAPDTNYLECNGAEVNRTTYSALFAKIGEAYGIGDGTTTFNLPDYRGEFLRGWDNSKGTDVGRTIGSFQTDQLKSHTHTHSRYRFTNASAGSGGTTLYQTTTATTGATGGDETRPRNYAVMYQIKAL